MFIAVFSRLYTSYYFRSMIRFGFYTPAVVLSSDLLDITIFTDHEFVDFRLLADGYALLEGRYYALEAAPSFRIYPQSSNTFSPAIPTTTCSTSNSKQKPEAIPPPPISMYCTVTSQQGFSTPNTGSKRIS